MNFDALTLASVCDELQQLITPGRVQQLLLVGPHALGMEIYAHGTRRYLLLNAAATDPRVHLVDDKLRRGPQAETPLLLLLRKYVRDALLGEVRQPDPAERLLELHFAQHEHGPTTLVVELIGRFTNLLLLREGKILDCLVRVPVGARGGRALLPGLPYTPPPRLNKIPPLDDGASDYYVRLAQVVEAEGTLEKALVAQVAGISPAQAREITWRAAGTPTAIARDLSVLALAQALQELWSPVRTGGWQPGVWLREGLVAGCSPYVAHTEGQWEPRPSMSVALCETAAHAQIATTRAADGYAAQRRSVGELIRKARTRLERQIAAAESDLPAPGAAALLRTHGEWLLALQHTLLPGQTELVVDAEMAAAAEPLIITLDHTQTPVEQAQALFRKAARLQRAAEVTPQRIARLTGDREYLLQLETDLALAQNQPEIAAVREELAAASLLPPQPAGKKPPRPPRSGPRLYAGPDGSRILVGRNARQNDELTFNIARPNDTWLHVRGAPGSHVVLQPRATSEPSRAALELAAQLAAYHSSLRGESAVDVVYTNKRMVGRVPGGRPGQVLLREEATIRVPALLPEGLDEQDPRTA